MHQTVRYRLEMMLGVDRLSSEPGRPANALATALFAANKTVIADMIAAAVAQAEGRGRFLGANADRMRTATRLRGLVRKVGLIAKVLDPAAFPELAQKVRAPRSASYQALIASAGAIKTAVSPAPIKAAFLARGMAAGFDAELGELIVTLQKATASKAGGRGIQVGGTAGLLAHSRRGLAVVRELNAIMTVILEDHPALLAQWKSVSHVQRPNKRAASEPLAGWPSTSHALPDPESLSLANAPAPSAGESEPPDPPCNAEHKEASRPGKGRDQSRALEPRHDAHGIPQSPPSPRERNFGRNKFWWCPDEHRGNKCPCD